MSVNCSHFRSCLQSYSFRHQLWIGNRWSKKQYGPQSMRPQKKARPSRLCCRPSFTSFRPPMAWRWLLLATSGPLFTCSPRRFLQLFLPFLAVGPLSQIIKSVKATCSSLGCDQPDTDMFSGPLCPSPQAGFGCKDSLTVDVTSNHMR